MINLKQLHDRDFNLWIEKTKEAIQNRDFENMDWDNLLDEIDDMGKSEKRNSSSLKGYRKHIAGVPPVIETVSRSDRLIVICSDRSSISLS